MTDPEYRKSIGIYPEAHAELQEVQKRMSLEVGVALNLRQTFELLIKNYLEKDNGRSENVNATQK